MSTYLLLRDNKESGPFSLDDLLAKGLKAYDLVWLPGKSAAWRYPSEIEELKAFAPATEEQPFDRFYKKQEEETPAVPQQEQQAVKPATTGISAYEPRPQATKPVFTPKKSVFVTLPSGNTIKTTPPDPAPQPAMKKEKPMSATTLNESLKPITVIENTEAALQTKYSQPLDDIKEMYVKTLVDRKQRNSRREFVTRHLKVAVIVFVLIGAGVLLGSMIRSSSGARKEASLPSRQASVPASSGPIAENSLAERLAEAEPVIVNQTPTLYAGEEEKLRKDVKEKTRDTDTKSSKTDRSVDENTSAITGNTPSTLAGKALLPRTEKKNEPQEQALYQTYETTSGGERNARTRSSTTATDNGSNTRQQNRFVPPVTEEEKPFAKEVTVLSNQYKRVPFGGIRNLQLTVYNRSAAELQKVVVELQYLKPSEQPLKTQLVEFESIAPNSSATIKIPDTNRGIDIAYEIKKVIPVK